MTKPSPTARCGGGHRRSPAGMPIVSNASFRMEAHGGARQHGDDVDVGGAEGGVMAVPDAGEGMGELVGHRGHVQLFVAQLDPDVAGTIASARRAHPCPRRRHDDRRSARSPPRAGSQLRRCSARRCRGRAVRRGRCRRTPSPRRPTPQPCPDRSTLPPSPGQRQPAGDSGPPEVGVGGGSMAVPPAGPLGRCGRSGGDHSARTSAPRTPAPAPIGRAHQGAGPPPVLRVARRPSLARALRRWPGPLRAVRRRGWQSRTGTTGATAASPPECGNESRPSGSPPGRATRCTAPR